MHEHFRAHTLRPLYTKDGLELFALFCCATLGYSGFSAIVHTALPHIAHYPILDLWFSSRHVMGILECIL